MRLQKHSKMNWKKRLESVSVLQQDVKISQNQTKEMQQANEELEQYGRSLCVRIDKVKCLIKENSCDIPDVVIDKAHQIGKCYYNNKKTNVRCKSITVRFTTFRQRTIPASICWSSRRVEEVFKTCLEDVFNTSSA